MFRYPLDNGAILSKKRKLRRELRAQNNLLQKRVALLSGATIGEIKPILELFLLSWGIDPLFFEGMYGLYAEELLFEDEALFSFQPDILYIHAGTRNIRQLPEAGDDEATVERKLKGEWDAIEAMLSKAAALGCPVILDNYVYPYVRVLGNRSRVEVSGKVRFIDRLNALLVDYAEGHRFLHIHDVNYLSAWYGLARWSDPTYYNAYKYALAPDAIPLLCLSLSSVIKALFGKNKKALMLDLDNTLWGGTIGDEGLTGIRLGKESPAGMSYLELQQYCAELRKTGVLLGVLSKNEQEAAKSGLTHPSSLLSAEDFSAFLADWNDKPGNLVLAANTLNLGTDAFVFLDDNPAERELMQMALPEVEVADYRNPEQVAAMLSLSGYFETVTLTEDDRSRAKMYKQNEQRKEEERHHTDYGAYLDALQMQAFFGSFSIGAERVTALVNKTNQFNLTTRRYTQEEIHAVERDADRLKIAVRLADKFGDNGIVSVLIAKIEGDEAVIELFVMSCRVFRRELEFAMFDELVRQASKRGVRTIRGQYIETEKNAVVRELLPALGFEKTGDAEAIYRIEEPYRQKNTHIEVHHA